MYTLLIHKVSTKFDTLIQQICNYPEPFQVLFSPISCFQIKPGVVFTDLKMDCTSHLAAGSENKGLVGH